MSPAIVEGITVAGVVGLMAWLVSMERRMSKKANADEVPPVVFRQRVERLESLNDNFTKEMSELKVHVEECKRDMERKS